MELQYTRELDDILTGAIALAGMDRARLVTPEHILMVAMGNPKEGKPSSRHGSCGAIRRSITAS